MSSIPKFKNEKEEAEFWMRNIFMFAMEGAYAETHPEAEEKRRERWQNIYKDLFGNEESSK